MRAARAWLLALALIASRAHAQADEPIAPDAGEPASAVAPVTPEPQAPEPAPEALPEDTPIALSEAELELLGLEPNREPVDKAFHFYGFADFSSFWPIQSNVSSLALGKRQSFYVGNVNLYLTRNLSESFRTLGEVRLTYLPNGSLNPNDAALAFVDTTVLDYADNSRVTRWGGVIIQRLYLEWTLHRFVTARAGQFLTPFGIWNVDHGSPAYIPVMRPYVLNSQSALFPERQTGIELFGRWDVANDVTLGYHLTLSNGGGSVSEYRDFDKNKALGARLYLEHHGTGYLRVGSSSYYGRDTKAILAPRVGAESVDVAERVVRQFDALSFAGDVLYKVRGLHLQGEIAAQQRRYTSQGRGGQSVYFAPSSVAFPQDFITYSWYALVAYELPWYALTPYVETQYSKDTFEAGFPGYLCKMWILQTGLNVHPIDEVVFKLEYANTWFPEPGPLFRNRFSVLQLQAAWAF